MKTNGLLAALIELISTRSRRHVLNFFKENIIGRLDEIEDISIRELLKNLHEYILNSTDQEFDLVRDQIPQLLQSTINSDEYSKILQFVLADSNVKYSNSLVITAQVILDLKLFNERLIVYQLLDSGEYIIVKLNQFNKLLAYQFSKDYFKDILSL